MSPRFGHGACPYYERLAQCTLCREERDDLLRRRSRLVCRALQF